ncbi:hypothetical protein G7Z17_g233 [Cylindrodendrum hubeiense]|uniref:Mid2 domain-containing protein n=1 Tax=Cylindrodendrum hubeiense TaxID=595255 RepID=A0A9P5LMI2_9HYPO|nr:hypothetical protein G7Z17_g233 [Cylindrodendrum hubeiense]
MFSPVLFGVCLVAFISGARSESAFVQPSNSGPANNYQDNPTYAVGKTIDVQWTSDLSSMDIVVWQQYPISSDSTNYVRVVDHTTLLTIDWKVSLKGFQTNVTEGEQAIFYFGMYETGATSLNATSHYFNVTVPSSYTTLSTSTTATATATADAVSTTAEATTTAASASAEATKKADSKLSTGAVAGIGVGAAIGGILALSGIGLFFWKRSRRGDSSGAYTQSQQSPPPEEPKHELAEGGWNHAPPQRAAVGPTGLYEAP